MKINLFGLGKDREKRQKEVKRVLHQIWQFNQKPPYLPAFCDTEFQKAYNYVKDKYGLRKLEEILEL